MEDDPLDQDGEISQPQDEYQNPEYQDGGDKGQFETYKKIKVLGKGSFGKAFLVECGSDGVTIDYFLKKICVEPSSN